ncbi:hypothetical protein [Nonomuraea sp. KM90]|uniref:hypothetical protein n=1 Tax=Nonomuraea sp. KM90 TaxID=3457428 RepID=UPI003FCC2E76
MAVALPAAPAVADGAPDERPDVPVGTWLAARTQPAVQLTSFTYTRSGPLAGAARYHRPASCAAAWGSGVGRR